MAAEYAFEGVGAAWISFPGVGASYGRLLAAVFEVVAFADEPQESLKLVEALPL